MNFLTVILMYEYYYTDGGGLNMSDSCKPMDHSLLGSSVHGISQARIQERLLFPSPANVPEPGINPHLLFFRWSPTLQSDSLPLSHQACLINKCKNQQPHI